MFGPSAVRDHAEFYRSGKRLEALRAIERERPSQSANDVRRKMLAVCAGADGDLDTVIEALLAELIGPTLQRKVQENSEMMLAGLKREAESKVREEAAS